MKINLLGTKFFVEFINKYKRGHFFTIFFTIIDIHIEVIKSSKTVYTAFTLLGIGIHIVKYGNTGGE